MSDTLPVFVEVPGSDGNLERVRVGTATRVGGGFTVTLTVQAGPGFKADAPPPRAAPRESFGGGSSSGGEPTNFPPYGRSKGLPIKGATMNDLEFYLNGSKRSLADPSKARFHDKEKALLAVIEAEIARQTGGSSGGGSEEPPPPSDEDAPF
jgi:hypothetical protein